jgi:hypothetical protein
LPDRGRLVSLLLDQARHCAALGSPLYAALLERAAEDAGAGGPTWGLLGDDEAPGPRADALALRLMAAAHRLALEGRASVLAARLPSTREFAGGDDVAATWRALRDLMAERADELRPLLARPCQTNEVGRSAALAYGFFEAAATGLPLRLLELGASAGLNLRFDHFRYGGGGASFGPADSPVDLVGLWREPPRVPRVLQVAERLGCDRRPVDPASEDGRLSLLASVWADQRPRFARLRGAIEVARRVPALVEAEDASEWLPRRLSTPSPGRASVVFHSIVDEYLTPNARATLRGALREAGARATFEAPLFWLRFEAVPGELHHAVSLVRWPGGEERLLAVSGAHGSDVRAAADV